jgi:hypothetical protein
MSVSFIDDKARADQAALLKLKAQAKLASVNASLDEEGFIFLSAEEAQQETGKNFPGLLRIDYYEMPAPDELPPHQRKKNFKRYRIIVPEGVPEPMVRYYQPPATENELYVPAGLDPAVYYDKESWLLITEGELKAVAACRAGLPAVGLPGIDNIRTTGGNLFPELDRLPPGKNVMIVFDKEIQRFDDAGNKVQGPLEAVLRARKRLGAMLSVRQLNVYFVDLPGAGKVQLDEYFSNGGSAAELRALARRLELQPSRSSDDALLMLQSEWLVLAGRMMHVKTGQCLPLANFKEQYNHFRDSDGKPVAAVFTASKFTTKVLNKTFDPRSAFRLVDCDGAKMWNMWAGYGTRPVKGDVSLFLDIINVLFQEEPEMVDEYFKTMALLMQRPWVKQQRYLLARSEAQGVGKSFILEMPACIINGTPRGEPQGMYRHALLANAGKVLEKNFNSSLGNIVYLVMNETGPRHKEITHLIKALTTDATIQIEEKYMPEVTVQNFVQLAISTNEPRVLDISETSRRDLCLPSVEPGSEHHDQVVAMWDRLKRTGVLDSEYRSRRFREAMLYYLLDYDLRGYDGTQAPPRNQSKAMAAADNMDEVDYYFKAYLDEKPEVIVPLIEYDKFLVSFPQTRISSVTFKNKLIGLGYCNPLFDRTFGQLRFNRLNLGTHIPPPFSNKNSTIVKVLPALVKESVQLIYEKVIERYGNKV